jgi:hypothetical protein
LGGSDFIYGTIRQVLARTSAGFAGRYNRVSMTRRSVQITPNHPVIWEYQRSLAAIRSQGIEHEGGLRRAFETLLSDSARLHNWTLISELGTRTSAGDTIRPDATLRDNLTLPRGYWEAKDSRDDLDREIERKIRRGYPLSNIIFEDTRRAVLYQNRDRVFEANLGDPRVIRSSPPLLLPHRTRYRRIQ